MSEPKEVQFLRPLNRKIVYPAADSIINRPDLYPCDKNGRFLSTGTEQPPHTERKVSTPDPTMETEEQVKENSERDALVARAKELGIGNYWNKKNETLIADINEAEAAEEETEED